MSRPRSSSGGKGVTLNGEPGVHACEFINGPSADETSERTQLSAFKKNTDARRLYLAGREYYGEDGRTCELGVVGRIKHQLNSDPTLRPEYPTSLGLTGLNRRASEIALGKSSRALVENRAFSVQTPGFTAAVRLGAELLRNWNDEYAGWCGPVYLSSPCDESLAGIFQAAGIQDIRQYSYWDGKKRGVCLEKLLGDLERAPERSVVVLSASAHYPTGADLSRNQWALIAQVIKALCSGDLERDAWPVRDCAAQGMELLCAQSFSHCFGLYGEAIGHLLCVLKQNSLVLSLRTRAEETVGSLWAWPSVGGAHVVATVLSNPALLVEWYGEIRCIVERCMLIRDILREKLRLLATPGCWDHLTQQGGLYCCTGLNNQQVEFLSKKRHIDLLPGGCLNVSAINGRNLDYVAESILLALTTSL